MADAVASRRARPSSSVDALGDLHHQLHRASSRFNRQRGVVHGQRIDEHDRLRWS